MVESLYLYHVLTAVQFLAILMLIGSIFIFATAAPAGVLEDSHIKWLIIVASICTLILVLIPRDRILALMLIAPYIEDNREVIQALPKEIADFLFNLIKEWKK